MIEIKKEIANRIRKARKAKDLKQHEVADRMNMAIGTYSNIENAKTNVPGQRLYMIANAIEVSVYSLMPPNIETQIAEDAEASKNVNQQLDELRQEIAELKKAHEYPILKPKRPKK